MNGQTCFENRAIHAACSKDRERIVDILVHHGGTLVCKNSLGETPMDVAKKSYSKHCVRKLRMLQLNISPPNGCVRVNRSNSGALRKTNISFQPHPPSTQRPHTSGQIALKKRHTIQPQAVLSKDTSASTRSSHEYFTWDTDNNRTRAASANRFRLSSACSSGVSKGGASAAIPVRSVSPTLSVGSSFTAVARVGTAPGKLNIKWGGAETRVATNVISRQEPGRKPFRHPHHSILKNRTDAHAVSIETIASSDGGGGDSEKGQQDQSDSECHVSVLSAPDLAKDSSVVGGNDARSVESAPDLQQAEGLTSNPPHGDRARSSMVSSRRR